MRDYPCRVVGAGDSPARGGLLFADMRAAGFSRFALLFAGTAIEGWVDIPLVAVPTFVLTFSFHREWDTVEGVLLLGGRALALTDGECSVTFRDFVEMTEGLESYRLLDPVLEVEGRILAGHVVKL